MLVRYALAFLDRVLVYDDECTVCRQQVIRSLLNLRRGGGRVDKTDGLLGNVIDGTGKVRQWQVPVDDMCRAETLQVFGIPQRGGGNDGEELREAS